MNCLLDMYLFSICSTVYEDQLKKHLKKCNQTKKTRVVSFQVDAAYM